MKKIINLISVIFAIVALPLSAQEMIQRVESQVENSVLDKYFGWEEIGYVYYGYGEPYECNWTCEVVGVAPEAENIEIYKKIPFQNSFKYLLTTTGFSLNGLRLLDGSVSNVKSVKIHISIESIPNYIFSGLPIERIEIPQSCTYIGNTAFKGCTSLKLIECPKLVPPTVSDYTFEGVPLDECIVYVRRPAVAGYKNHPIWGKFNIQEKDFSGIDEVTDVNDDLEVSFEGGSLTSLEDGLSIAVYTVDGRCVVSDILSQGERIELPAHGIYIVVADGKSKKIIY